MKLYFVMTVMQVATSVWGPLPYDMKECLRRRVEWENRLDKYFVEQKNPFHQYWVLKDGPFNRGDVGTFCILRDRKPEIGDDIGEANE